MSFLNCPICGHPKTTCKGEILDVEIKARWFENKKE